VDVVVRQNGAILYVEAKFHNAAGFKTDLKTVLYVKARLDDIRAARKNAGAQEPMRGMVVTNTKFTSVAAGTPPARESRFSAGRSRKARRSTTASTRPDSTR